GDTPAHLSAVGRDPAYPAGTSSLTDILARGTNLPVRQVGLDELRRDAASLRRALERIGRGIVAADAGTESDLEALASVATAPGVMLAGSAGLARAVAARLGHEARPPALPRGRAWLIAVGSLHPASRAQLDALATAGVARAIVDPDGPEDLGAIAGALRAGRPASLATPVPVAAATDGRSRARAALARACAEVLRESEPDLIAVTGGETACALLEALGADPLPVSGAPASGLALGEVVPDTLPRLTLLTKAGGVGPPDLLVQLLGGQS